MEFFTDHDWLHRQPPHAFQWDHILFIVLAMIVGIVAAIILRKKASRKVVHIVLISLWGVYIAVVLTYYIFIYSQVISNPSEHPFSMESMLPLHSCLMFMYVCPFALFSKNKIVRTAASNFLVIINMIMGFITLFVGCPSTGYSALSFHGIQSLIYHAIDVIVPLIMLVTKYYDIQKKDFLYGLAVFVALAVTVWIFDAIARCDYFYFYDGHTFPVFKFISENVHHLVWTLIVGSCYIITAIATHFSAIGIKALVNLKKNKTSEA